MEHLAQGPAAELLRQRVARDRRAAARGESPDDPDDAPLASRRPRRAAAAPAPPQGENQSSSDEDSSSDHGLDSDPEFETTSGAKSTRRGAQKKKPTGPLCTDISFDPYNSPNLDRVEEDDDVDLTREGLMALLHKSIELNDEVERIGKEAGAYGLKFVQQHWQDYLVKFGICLDVNVRKRSYCRKSSRSWVEAALFCGPMAGLRMVTIAVLLGPLEACASEASSHLMCASSLHKFYAGKLSTPHVDWKSTSKLTLYAIRSVDKIASLTEAANMVNVYHNFVQCLPSFTKGGLYLVTNDRLSMMREIATAVVQKFSEKQMRKELVILLQASLPAKALLDLILKTRNSKLNKKYVRQMKQKAKHAVRKANTRTVLASKYYSFCREFRYLVPVFLAEHLKAECADLEL